jgi:deoxyhypusine synthase
MTGTEAMLDIVDFVEELGGTLGQEERNELIRLVQTYSKAIFTETLADASLGDISTVLSQGT